MRHSRYVNVKRPESASVALASSSVPGYMHLSSDESLSTALQRLPADREDRRQFSADDL